MSLPEILSSATRATPWLEPLAEPLAERERLDLEGLARGETEGLALARDDDEGETRETDSAPPAARREPSAPWPETLARLRARLLPTDRRSPWISLATHRQPPRLPQRLWGPSATTLWAHWALDGAKTLPLDTLAPSSAPGTVDEGGEAGARLARPWEVRAAKDAARHDALLATLGEATMRSADGPLQARGASSATTPVAVLPLWPEEAAKLATAAQQQTRSVFESIGLHPLHLVLGVVSWQSHGEEAAHLAPWLAWPVHVRGDAATGWRLEPASDEPTVNAALIERLARSGLQGAFSEVPPADIEELHHQLAAFETVRLRAAAVGLQVNLRDGVWLAELTGGQDRLWADLDPSAWRGGAAGLLQPPVAELLGTSHAPVAADWLTTPAELLSVDRPHPVRGTPAPRPVIAADASQLTALWDVRDSRASQVIIGPPGTGKSQTIVNLLAEALSRGQRVLFVAQKPAALTVVQQRLEQIGLGPFVLPLYGDEDLRDRVLRQTDRVLAARQADAQGRAGGDGAADMGAGAAIDDAARSLGLSASDDDAPIPAALAHWDAAMARPWGPSRRPLSAWARDAVDVPATMDAAMLGAALSSLEPGVRAQWDEADTPTHWERLLTAWWVAHTARLQWGEVTAMGRELATMAPPGHTPPLDAWMDAIAQWRRVLVAFDRMEAPTDLDQPRAPLQISSAEMTRVMSWVAHFGAGPLPFDAGSAELRQWCHGVFAQECVPSAHQIAPWRRTVDRIRYTLQSAALDLSLQQIRDALGVLQRAPVLERWLRATSAERRALRDWLQAQRPSPAEGAGSGSGATARWRQWVARFGASPAATPSIRRPTWLDEVVTGADARVRRAVRRALRPWRAWAPATRGVVRELARVDAAGRHAIHADLAQIAQSPADWQAEPLSRLLSRLDAVFTEVEAGASPSGTSAWRAHAAELGPWPEDAPRAVWVAHHAQRLEQLEQIGRDAQQRAAQQPWLDGVAACWTAQSRVADLLGLEWQTLRIGADRLAAGVRESAAIPPGAWPAIWREQAAWQDLAAAGLSALAPVVARCSDVPCVAQVTKAAIAHLGWRAALDADAQLQLLEDAVLQRERSAWRTAQQDALLSRRRALETKLLRVALQPQQVTTSSGQMRGLQFLAQQQGLTRRKPLRHWFRSAGEELLTLCPLVMATPLELARHVAPDALAAPFDLVVLDEASQIRPEFALGALARATRAVVVGDPRQLGPDRVAGTAGGRDEEDDDESREADGASRADGTSAAGGAADPQLIDPVRISGGERSLLERAESLLSAAVLRWPAHLLRWHYRSRHASLMAFSNRRYYDGQLHVMPTPPRVGRGRSGADDARRGGVRLDRVSGYAVRRGKGVTNPVEAERVVWHLEQLASLDGTRRPSVLVATFNRAQAERITQILARDASPALVGYQSELATRGEPLRVLPLDLIQGEERDVVLIATTYAREAWEGAPAPSHFGPLGQQGGERRMNVLLTRARDELIVVTSLRPLQDLRIGPHTGQGVRDLQAFLQDAESGELAPDDAPLQPPEGPWRHLASELERHGATVGRGPLFGNGALPLMVVSLHGRPLPRPRLVLGDDTMAAAGPSATDRHLGLVEQLTQLGWDVVRVGWLEWFRAPERVCARILDPTVTPA